MVLGDTLLFPFSTSWGSKNVCIREGAINTLSTLLSLDNSLSTKEILQKIKSLGAQSAEVPHFPQPPHPNLTSASSLEESVMSAITSNVSFTGNAKQQGKGKKIRLAKKDTFLVSIL